MLERTGRRDGWVAVTHGEGLYPVSSAISELYGPRWNNCKRAPMANVVVALQETNGDFIYSVTADWW